MKNKVNLIGRLGKDPEIKHFEGGSVKATFSLATDEKYKDKSGEVKTITDWHNIVIWGKSAEVAEKYLKKGSLIDIEGKIRQRSWESQEGEKKYITEIICDRFIMLGSKNQSGGGEAENGSHESGGGNNEFSPGNTYGGPTDDLPF